MIQASSEEIISTHFEHHKGRLFELKIGPLEFNFSYAKPLLCSLGIATENWHIELFTVYHWGHAPKGK